MGIWTRLFGTGSKATWAPNEDRSLVDPPRRQASALIGGKAANLQITPWSATRLAGIFTELSQRPNAQVLTEARKARHCLSRFWLGAPVDQLEILYRSPIGQCYRLLLQGMLAAQSLEPGEQQWRTALSRRLMENFDRPETTNLLLATMPYFERGKMRVANPLQQVPQWLLTDYAALFDPQLEQQLRRPVGLLGPVGTVGTGMAYPPQQLVRQPHPIASPPMAGPLPVMATLRGNEAMALAQNQEFIGRMDGLVKLYSIDQNDADVKRELIGLRRQMGQVWLDVNPAQVQALYQSSFGQLYRTFLGCGFSREALIPEDQQLRGQLAQVVGNMSQPRALNALLAALPFFQPGRIEFGGGEQFIPPWLMQDIQALNRSAAPARI
jgi:hypothetical protein